MSDITLFEGNNELNVALQSVVEVGWVSPTGHSDPDNAWDREEEAYDGIIDANWAYSITAGESWGSYLILFINETYINKIRFHARLQATGIRAIDVDVYYEGAWHDVYEGIYPNMEWLERAIPAGTKLVSKARVRFQNIAPDARGTNLNEFQFNTV